MKIFNMSEELDNSEIYKRSFFSRHSNWIMFSAFLTTIISPYFITGFSVYELTNWPFLKTLGFGEKTAWIGDTIGGITAPIVNIFAALLVFIAFKEQVRTNDIQFKAIRDDRKDRLKESKVNDQEKMFKMILQISAQEFLTN